jgi:hypothetical protein
MRAAAAAASFMIVVGYGSSNERRSSRSSEVVLVHLYSSLFPKAIRQLSNLFSPTPLYCLYYVIKVTGLQGRLGQRLIVLRKNSVL